MSNFNKSALTDHATTGNHIIDWEGAKIYAMINCAILLNTLSVYVTSKISCGHIPIVRIVAL